ncbi:MAG: hypothetical protein J7K22_02865 [Nanoarchaeota archaeon]|nr:hypothetical protein [Nanoarchaeota archaeon]
MLSKVVNSIIGACAGISLVWMSLVKYLGVFEKVFIAVSLGLAFVVLWGKTVL